MWRALTSTEITGTSGQPGYFTASEQAGLNAVQGATTGLANKLTVVVREWIGAVAATSSPVNNDGSVPDQLRRHILAATVWAWLTDFPSLKFFKTKAREDANKEAAQILAQIIERKYGSIESPYGIDVTTGNWNSAPMVLGRMNPIPTPRLQMQAAPTPLFANPNAPSLDVPVNTPGAPGIPPLLTGTGQNTQVLLEWDAGSAAVTYNVYRSLTSGQETLLVGSIANLYYTDAGLTNGTPYFYRIAGVNPVGTSPLSNEVQVIPNPQPPPA